MFLLMGKNSETAIERIERIVPDRPEGQCWIPLNKPDTSGYVRISWGGRLVYLHRFVYAVYVGQPEGTLDHLCRNRACCNPAHMEAVTNKVNILRGEAPTAHNARKTHCIRGHEFNEQNTYHCQNPDGTVRRICRRCNNELTLRRYHERRTGSE